MGRSLYLGKYFGIPVYVHWTFGFILLFVTYIAVTEAMIASTIFWFVAYILTLFFCVICHEYGHALAARRYGVITKDIIISPIGGVARMESMPKKPWMELVIAIAGPLVNVAFAVVLGFAFFFIFNESFISPEDFKMDLHDFESYLRLVIVLNIALFLFNLIPAFPMDGGRILRALLSMKWGRVRATSIASYIGRAIAICLLGIGIWFSHWSLCFIGVFVYYMARMENQQTQIQSNLEKTIAGEIMDKDYTMIFSDDSINKVVGFYQKEQGKNFLVFDQSKEVVGTMPELFIQQLIKNNSNLNQSVRSLMSTNFAFFEEKDDLLSLFEEMNKKGIAIVGIKNGDQLTGVIDRHIINSFLKART